MAVYNMTTAYNGYGDIMGAEHMDLEREHVSISKASQLTARANKEDKKVLLQISYLLDKKKQQKNKKDMVDYHSSFKNEDYESKIGCDPDLISYGSTTCSTITHSNYSHDSASVDLVDDDGYSIQSPDESHYGGDQELDDPLLQHQGPPRNKTEERALKRIRRKIKNKLSAQESRRKKKEYLENLEKTVVSCTSENGLLKEQVSSLNNTVRQLLRELKRIQEAKSPSQDQGTQTGICLKCHLNKSSKANHTHHKS